MALVSHIKKSINFLSYTVLAIYSVTILLKFREAIVHPGEMVGVVAGQSVGAPTTQLTLNSVTYETEIVVRDKVGIVYRTKRVQRLR